MENLRRRSSQAGSPRAASDLQSSTSSDMLDIEFVERTDVGRVRDHNEDYLGLLRHRRLPRRCARTAGCSCLADGVGGHEKGEVASRTAVESMIAGFRKAKDGESHSAALAATGSAGQYLTFLKLPLPAGVNPRAWPPRSWPARCGLTAYPWRHVGDSRCYLIRNGKATQITRDHTVASEQVRLGLVTAQEAADGETQPYPQPVARNRIDCKCGYQRPPDFRR